MSHPLVLRASFVTALTLLLGAASAQQFEGVPPLPVGAVLQPTDLDLDGLPDLLAFRNRGFELQRNNGFLRFGTVQPLLGSLDQYPGAAAVADFDGDTDLDIAVAAVTFPAQGAFDVHLFQQNAGTWSGSIVATLSPLGGGGINSLLAIDFDGDGDRDLAVITGWLPGSNLFALRNDGIAGFTNVTSTWFAGIAVSQPNSATVLDVDRDGRPDLLIAAGMATLLRNHGTHFVDESSTRVPAVYLVSPACGDLDGDGDDDVVGRQVLTSNGMRVWLNQAGTFVDVTATHMNGPLATTIGADHPVLFDADRDGDLDAALLVTNGLGNYTVRILSNDGAGRLLQQQVQDVGAMFPYPILLPAADLDGDGDADVVACGTDLGPPLVLCGDGAGRLRRPRDDLALAGSQTIGLAVDVDGDGDLDLVGPDGVRRFDPGPRWTQITTFATNTVTVTSLQQFGDVDRDGDLDLVSANVLRNDGQGHFTVDPASGFQPPATVTPVFGDFDNDGDLDIVASQGSFPNDTVKLHLNLGNGTFAPGTVLIARVAQTLAVADLDGDGNLDVACGDGYPFLLMGTGGGAFTIASLFNIPILVGRPRPIDLTGTGLPDLLFDGAPFPPFLPRVARRQGTQYVDVTGSVLPPGLNVASFAIGDIDGDGDTDLVGQDVLRNDGTGALILEPLGLDTAGATQLADIDGDGDPDLVLMHHVLWNREHHLHLPLEAHTNRNLRIDLSARPGRASNQEIALLGIGLARHSPGLPGPLGILHLARVDALIALLLPVGTGLLELDVPVPNVPAIVGVDVHLQALHFGPADLVLGNLATTRIE